MVAESMEARLVGDYVQSVVGRNSRFSAYAIPDLADRLNVLSS